MIKYYTRACNFFYGNQARKFIKNKTALPLCGSNRIAFNSLEIFTRRKKDIKSKYINIKDIKSMTVIDDSYNWVIKDAGSRLNAYKEASILSAIAENVQHFIMLLGLGIIITSKGVPKNVSRYFPILSKILKADLSLVGAFSTIAIPNEQIA